MTDENKYPTIEELREVYKKLNEDRRIGEFRLPNPNQEYMDEVVTRCAPRWAWDYIDNWLSDNYEMCEVKPDVARSVMIASENPNLYNLPREALDFIEKHEELRIALWRGDK